jgi:hypothetical protein
MEEINDFYAIVVVYQLDEGACTTLKKLDLSLKKINKKIRVIIYDNSENESIFNKDNAIKIYQNLTIEYISDNKNPGLAVAYNFALENNNQAEYLILFDQDTTINEKYLEELFGLNKIYDCFIPMVYSTKNQPISPVWFNEYGGTEPIKDHTTIKAGFLTAINSGTIVKVESIKKIGGFPLEFSLDMLDHYTFYLMSKMNFNIYKMNSSLFQDLSIDDYGKNISFKRFKSILDSEIKLIDKMSFVKRHFFILRLLVRSFRLLLQNQIKCSVYIIKSLINV